VSEGAEGRSAENVWIGGLGVTRAAHYDTSYNLYLQLHGVKTFALRPMEVSTGEYSVLHPYCRRYQGPYAAVMKAELHPGDILYLPPYIYHEVKAEPGPPSLSANIWANGPLSLDNARLIQRAGSGQLVSVAGLEVPEKAAALEYIMKQVLATVLTTDDAAPGDWLAGLATRRWKSLVRALPPSDVGKSLAEWCRQSPRRREAMQQSVQKDALLIKTSATISQGLEALREANGNAVRDMETGHVLEALAFGFFGRPEHVGIFLTSCFVTDAQP